MRNLLALCSALLAVLCVYAAIDGYRDGGRDGALLFSILAIGLLFGAFAARHARSRWRRPSAPDADAKPAARVNAQGAAPTIPAKATPTVVTFTTYRADVRHLPRPSPPQCRAFAQFVCTAHSWYKHIPLGLPGVPIYFFLDPHAGMDRAGVPGRDLHPMARPVHGMHHSALATAEHLERFGHLSYECDDHLDHRRRHAPEAAASLIERLAYFDATGRWCALPPQVLSAGKAEATGVIHLASENPRLWVAAYDGGVLGRWPEESGGADQLARIIARCRELIADPAARLPLAAAASPAWEGIVLSDSIDAILRELLEPERARQLEGLYQAIVRMVAVIDG